MRPGLLAIAAAALALPAPAAEDPHASPGAASAGPADAPAAPPREAPAADEPAPSPPPRFLLLPGGENRVVFESRAPLETFRGRTDRVRGELRLDPAAVGDSVEIVVRVDLASLETGIGLRDRNMRENHLHTDRFPEAVFRGARVIEGAGADLSDGAEHALRIEGELELHGVRRTLAVPVRLARATSQEGGEAIALHAEFEIRLGDYGIPRPRMLFLRLNEVQRITVDLLARAHSM